MPAPISAILTLKRREVPLAGLMFTYLFLVITTFWILKPIKKAAFLGYYDARKLHLLGAELTAPDAELIAKVANMVVAFLAVVVFSRLARDLRRQHLTYVFCGVCALCLVGFLSVSSTESEAVAWLLYLYGDLFSTVMVTTFFAFLNDSFSPESAKRSYGVIVLGGVAGGAFGSLVVNQWISDLEVGHWLQICLGLTLLIAGVAALAGREVAKNPPKDAPASGTPDPPGNPALEGVELVARSRYLLAVVTMVALYEIVSTILDYQFSATVVHLVPTDAIGEHFATVYLITNVFALLVQLLATGPVMARLGMPLALLIMPLAIVGVSVGFLLVPILWVGSFLNTVDNGLNYSINQSAREALYTPTTRNEKYKAKAFIDMFVQRFAKVLAVGVSLAMSWLFGESFAGVRYLSIVVVMLVGVWIVAARYAGAQFERFDHGA